MDATTYEQFVGLDPTKSFLFRAAIVLERLITAFRVRLLIEVTRLVLLGFYDDFRTFLDAIEGAEDQTHKESEYIAIWSLKTSVAEKTGKLVERLESIRGITYRGKNLGDYLIGKERLDHLKLFVEVAKLERQGEDILRQARKDFLASFAKYKLTSSQRTALLEKYKELSKLSA